MRDESESEPDANLDVIRDSGTNPRVRVVVLIEVPHSATTRKTRNSRIRGSELRRNSS